MSNKENDFKTINLTQCEIRDSNHITPLVSFTVRKPYQRQSNVELIQILNNFHEDIGRAPTMFDFTGNPKYPDVGCYKRKFGSWNNALAIAGLKIRKKVKRYDTNELIQILRDKSTELKQTPTVFDFRFVSPGASIFIERFGS